MSMTPTDLDALVAQKYRHGFVTDIESDTLPPGLDEDVIRLDLAHEGRARVHARLASQGLPALADDAGARLGHTCASRRSTTRGSPTTRRRGKKDGPKSLDEVDPKLLDTYEKLGVPLHERARLAGVAVDAVFDSVSVATTFKDRLAKAGVIFCPFSDAVRNHPELVERYLGSVVPHPDNYFAALNSAVFTDGSFVLRAEGRALPHGAVDLLPHQRREHGPVRADADRRRGRQPRELPRGLHGADARREPAARGSRGAGGARRCPDQVLDGAELVSGRRERRRRNLQLRHQARRVPRRELAHLLDSGRDRLGDHLEIPELHPRGRELGRRVLLGRARPTTASRPTPAPR